MKKRRAGGNHIAEETGQEINENEGGGEKKNKGVNYNPAVGPVIVTEKTPPNNGSQQPVPSYFDVGQ